MSTGSYTAWSGLLAIGGAVRLWGSWGRAVCLSHLPFHVVHVVPFKPRCLVTYSYVLPLVLSVWRYGIRMCHYLICHLYNTARPYVLKSGCAQLHQSLFLEFSSPRSEFLQASALVVALIPRVLKSMNAVTTASSVKYDRCLHVNRQTTSRYGSVWYIAGTGRAYVSVRHGCSSSYNTLSGHNCAR